MITTEKEQHLVNPLLKTIGEDVMGFLNEIQLQYPSAISLASGRPDDSYFHLQNFTDYFNIYIDSLCTSPGSDRQKIINSLGQYGRTKGIINDVVAKFLLKDEAINASPEDIVITVGTQEALALAVMTLCDREKDVVVVEDPTYIGITHFSAIAGYTVEPVPVNTDGMSIQKLEEKISDYNSKGKKVKLVYVIADYQNPTGNNMSLANRHKLLELADQYDFLILEDNAYGEFCYDDQKIPALKALDTNNRVIYLRSFSKTLYPQLRLGALVAGQKIKDAGKVVALSDLIAKTKGYTTVNTSSINQAILGGILVKNNFSLRQINQEKVESMKRKRNLLMQALTRFFKTNNESWAKGISWNTPNGGFFATIHVPFNVTKKEVIVCAEQYGLIFTPMSFFYFKEGGDQDIRIAFSNLSDEAIEPAIERLANYIKNKISSIN
jgi:(S)-3,5-dihydroxyphenylglycine transaminase